MRVRIIDHTSNHELFPKMLKKMEFEFAWRYEQGKYQFAKYPTPTYLNDPIDEDRFMNGEEVWVHRDEVSIVII